MELAVKGYNTLFSHKDTTKCAGIINALAQNCVICLKEVQVIK